MPRRKRVVVYPSTAEAERFATEHQVCVPSPVPTAREWQEVYRAAAEFNLQTLGRLREVYGRDVAARIFERLMVEAINVALVPEDRY